MCVFGGEDESCDENALIPHPPVYLARFSRRINKNRTARLQNLKSFSIHFEEIAIIHTSEDGTPLMQQVFVGEAGIADVVHL